MINNKMQIPLVYNFRRKPWATPVGIYNLPLNTETKKDITIQQAARGLAGAVTGAVIETMGNTASSIINFPKALYEAYKSVWKTELIGPVLKTSISTLIPLAAAAAPFLVAIISCGTGIYYGFLDGINNDIKNTIDNSIKRVKKFHNETTKQLFDILNEFEKAKPPAGQKPYDIKLAEAGNGLAGALMGAAIGGIGFGTITLLNTPRGIYKVYKDILKSSDGPVLKAAKSLIVPPLAILATPLATVGGAIYGLSNGFHDAYKEGIPQSIKNRIENLKSYNKSLNETFN